MNPAACRPFTNKLIYMYVDSRVIANIIIMDGGGMAILLVIYQASYIGTIATSDSES